MTELGVARITTVVEPSTAFSTATQFARFLGETTLGTRRHGNCYEQLLGSVVLGAHATKIKIPFTLQIFM